MSYVPTLAPIEEDKEEQPQVIFLPNNSKKKTEDDTRRHIRKERKSYFKDAVENKKWESDEFLDDIYDWYFA
jgi:hypothetical protein